MAKRPRDTNSLAANIVAEATGQAEKVDPDAGKDAAKVELGRQGGLRGGKARASSLSAERRSEIAREAARARWGRTDRQP